MVASIDFAFRGIYHVYRMLSDLSGDVDVVECLLREILVNASTGIGPSDMCLDDDEATFGLNVAPAAPINHLPTGIHTVWAIGRVEFHSGSSWDDDGGSVEVHLTFEGWSPANTDEIRQAEHDSGVDLSEFYRA